MCGVSSPGGGGGGGGGGRGHDPPGLWQVCSRRHGCPGNAHDVGDPSPQRGFSATGCSGGKRPTQLVGQVATGGKGGLTG